MFKQKIEEYKKKANRTNAEIAKFLGVRKSVIDNYLSGKKELDISLTKKINLNIEFMQKKIGPVEGFINQNTMDSFLLAKGRGYLDRLHEVYPIADNPTTELKNEDWLEVETAFNGNDHKKLIKKLLNFKKFPIEDSYVSFLRRNTSAISKNNTTVERIATRLHKIGLEEMKKKCVGPINPSRQIGPMFKKWVGKIKGIPVFMEEDDFLKCKGKAIFNASDKKLHEFAEKYLGYTKGKGLDFVAKSSNTYVLGEAKFLTGFGGSQNQQFDDACSTATAILSGGELSNVKVKTIAILDGVLYIPGNNHFTKYCAKNPDTIIISSLLLEKYLKNLK